MLLFLQKNMLYIKYINTLSVIGLIAVFVLQTVWFYNTYVYTRENIKKECNSIFDTALYEEANLVSKHIPNGTIIAGNAPNDSISFNTYIYDGISKLGYEYSLSDIDSLITIHLKKNNIQSDFFVAVLDQNVGNRVIQNSQPDKRSNVLSIKSDIIPIRLDKSIGMQLILINPYSTIIKRIWIIVFTTAIVTILILVCSICQIKHMIYMKRISQIREDFSYALIHDMKNPLSTIFTTLNFLHTGRLDDKPEKREKYFRIAEGEVDHLLTLTNKVLTVSKLEQHKLDMQKEKIELPPMIDKLVDKFTAKADKPIRFIKDLQATEVYADAEYLEEVLDNLIDNAVKYSKENVEITLSSSCNGRHTFLRVHDNGIGISDKDQKVIFNKYERGAAGRRKRKQGASGFGLGLNFVQQVVEAHGGNIFVNSIEGEFTEFVISLPLQDLN